MWEAVIIIVGGIYWVYKYIDEKTNKEIAQKYRNNADAINKRITASADEEYFIKRSLKNEETRWEMLNSISHELNEIYGYDWRRYFQEDSKFESDYTMISFPWGKAYHLLLSKRGKIPSLFASMYQLGGVGNEGMEYIIRTCEYIEKNINSFYPELKMVFVPGRDISTEGTDHRFYEELYLGRLYWEHNLPQRNKNWNPPIKRLW